MKNKIKKLSDALKDVHKVFLEKERQQAEQYFERKIAPFEFVLMLTQDQGFLWLQPFSALIAEIDAFSETEEEITQKDLVCISEKIDFLLKDPASSVMTRYHKHLSEDPAFIMFHAGLKKELTDFLK